MTPLDCNPIKNGRSGIESKNVRPRFVIYLDFANKHIIFLIFKKMRV